jgi:hypothetical protein
MVDIINDIVIFLDKREFDVDSFLTKFSETDIVDDFINTFDKLNLKSSQFIQIIDVEQYELDGCFDNYLKHIFKYSMHLLFNYNNNYGISVVESKIRRLCNIYINDSTNIVNCLNSIKNIIDHVINFNMKFEKYSKFKITIISTIINSINKNLTTRYVYEYTINTLDVY